uniref:Polyprotein n=1 Tax=Snowy daisy-bush nepovirus TaxID=3115778 RepID=A0AAT9JJ06_9SECO
MLEFQPCGPSCGLRVYPSKRAFLKACSEGDLTRDGRCHLCQSFASFEKQVDVPKTSAVAGPLSDNQAQKVVKRTQPLKKQRCDVVVSCPPLELVYPALVVEEPFVAPKRARPMRLIEAHGEPVALTVEEAPQWLVPKAPRVVAPKVPVALTQQQEFSLLKKRLARKGKLALKEAFLRRQKRRTILAKKLAKIEEEFREELQVASHKWGKKMIRALGLGSMGNLALEPSSSVRQQWRKDEERQALLRQDLAEKKKLARLRKFVSSPRVGVPTSASPADKEMKTATMPWQSLGLCMEAVCRPHHEACMLGVFDSIPGRSTCQSSMGVDPITAVATQVVHQLRERRSHLAAIYNGGKKMCSTVIGTIKQTASFLIGGLLDLGHPNKGVDIVNRGIPVPLEELGHRTHNICQHLPLFKRHYDGIAFRGGAFKTPRSELEEIYMDVDPCIMHDCVCIDDESSTLQGWEVHLSVPEWQHPVPLVLHQEPVVLETTTPLILHQEPVVLEATIPLVLHQEPTALETVDIVAARHDQDMLEAIMSGNYVAAKIEEATIPKEIPYEELFGNADYTCANIARALCSKAIKAQRALRISFNGKFIYDEPIPHYKRTGSFVLRNMSKRQHTIRILEDEDMALGSLWSGDRPSGNLVDDLMLTGMTLERARNIAYNGDILGEDRHPRYWQRLFPDYRAEANAVRAGKIFAKPRKPIWELRREAYDRRMAETEYYSIFYPGFTFFPLHVAPEWQHMRASPPPPSLWSRILWRPQTDFFEDACDELPNFTCQSSLGMNRREEEIVADLEDRAMDHNASMGVRPIAEVIEELRNRKTSVKDSSQNRNASTTVELKHSDVFKSVPIVKEWISNKRNKQSQAIAQISGTTYDISLPKPGEFTYTPLPVLSEEVIRKYSDGGWSHSSVVALDIHVESLLPQGMPIEALTVICDGQTNDMSYAALCGGYISLGEERSKILSLPLIKFSLNDALQDIDVYLTGLYLATTVSRLNGSKVGRKALKYTVMGFSEQKKNALSSTTSVKDSFEAILTRQKRQQSSRIVAALNYDDVFSQGLHQDAGDFPAITYMPRPDPLAGQWTIENGQFVMRTEQTKGLHIPSKVYRSRSMRQANLPWHSRVDRGNFETEEFQPPCMSKTMSGLGVKPWSATSTFEVAGEATGGEIVWRGKLRDIIANAGTTAITEWRQQLLKPCKVTGRLYIGSSIAAGTTLGLVCDAFNRAADLTVFPVLLGNAMYQEVFPLADATRRTFSFSMNELVGFELHPDVTGFDDVTFLIYILTTNDVPCNSKWQGAIFFRLEEDDTPFSSVTLPLGPRDVAPLNVWRGPVSVDQATLVRNIILPLNFAEPREWLSSHRAVIPFNLASLGMYQGYGGTIHGEIIKIGSSLVQADIYVSAMYGSNESVDIATLIKYPGWELEAGVGKFSVPLNSPFGATSTRDKQAHINFNIMAGPIAPKDVTASFKFMVKLSHITFSQVLPPTISNRLEFEWATLSNINVEDLFFDVAARLPDLVLNKATVVMIRHPLAQMVASSGLLSGEMVLSVRWEYNDTISAPKGGVTLTSYFGSSWSPTVPKYVVRVKPIVASEPTLSVPGVVAHIGKYTRSAGFEGQSNQFRICVTNAKALKILNISVELKPGFEFRGPTITPLLKLEAQPVEARKSSQLKITK